MTVSLALDVTSGALIVAILCLSASKRIERRRMGARRPVSRLTVVLDITAAAAFLVAVVTGGPFMWIAGPIVAAAIFLFACYLTAREVNQ